VWLTVNLKEKCNLRHFFKLTVTTLQAVTWAGAARRIPRRRNSAGRRCTPSGRTGPGVQRPEAPTTSKVLLAACRVLAPRAEETSRAERSQCANVTTLQAVTWAGAARRIPRRKNSAEGQYTRYYALGQGCKDPKPLRPIVKWSLWSR